MAEHRRLIVVEAIGFLEPLNTFIPVIGKHLKETFGVMVYQEDVIKICHHFAGLDLADADILRRAMAGKFRLSLSE